MHIQWIAGSSALPREGQEVEFMLDRRDVAMAGSYVQRIFKTRWTAYEAERVCVWRSAESNGALR